MIRISQIKLPLDHSSEQLRMAVCQVLRLSNDDLLAINIVKRSVDARKKQDIQLVYNLDIEVSNEAFLLKKFPKLLNPSPNTQYQWPITPVQSVKERPVVIGTGPCGFLAGLLLAQMGLKPIILERGKSVRQRTKDTWGLWRQGILNPDSNVQYGEGGAGTFSDGKLYSQIKDPRHLGRKVLEEFVRAGAPSEILYINRPHIGTFRLVTMVESMRNSIEQLGGEVRFEQKVVDFLIDDSGHERQITGVVLQSGETIHAQHVALAIGHSARETFQVLYDRGVYIEAKPFSIGVRIEHPQSLIDAARFGSFAGHPILGAAEYKLVHHAKNGRAAYSFCMCPGGTVVAATSEEGRVVTNGMSQYSRNERNANSGLVVNIHPEQDYPSHPLAGIELQRHWEHQAFLVGGSNYFAPVQKVGDFLKGRASSDIGSVIPSYTPGVTPSDLRRCLPDFVAEALFEAIPQFDQQIRGYAMDDAIMTAVETRTSSPIRITRSDDFQSLNTKGLYPAGEGAGYAGGIFSAGVDGIKVAEAIALSITGGPKATGGSRGVSGDDYGA